ncbi:tryptophan synthase subunit alpha [Bowmanella sp. JS7-9]|uniref:Tryptophan synthase alpha chain n=1 Tax=Pseudobowmanella zhangzhouensis TaxID=1537679 RepID=A0ABW1XNY3_9ALTE|nr:tryptophan synthase subunit alpha [Bowmanella sp. JS7-9]TBX22464.1 tryptophan synthase alpha chain [Bowmanella sp. JS7-9]
MAADRYQAMFSRLAEEQRGAFVPFVMLGDPDKATSIEIISALVDGGADALELGFPFSDPIADGPVIQKAGIRALANKIHQQDCFEILSEIRRRHPQTPIGLLLYSNLVFHTGLDAFYAKAAQAGVDSVLLADVPLREAEIFQQTAQAHNIHHILIAPPNADDEALKQIASQSSGYIYLLGRAGVTGTETAANAPVKAMVDKLSVYKGAPSVIGFGISNPAQVKAAIGDGAAGAIAGSATVKIIEQHLHDVPAMLSALKAFVAEMKSAT